jgi:hypothetical protein
MFYRSKTGGKVILELHFTTGLQELVYHKDNRELPIGGLGLQKRMEKGYQRSQTSVGQTLPGFRLQVMVYIVVLMNSRITRTLPCDLFLRS